MPAAMNYKHIYHAGNFADVAKHVGLMYCLGALQRKDAAFFVLDSHAGRGYYDLRAAEREIESLGRVRTEIGDGYAALKAFLPPDERRGLVLIDPPYESLDELKLMLQAFAEAYHRWASGIFLMWYPIRSATQRSMVHARFEALQIPKMLFADLAIHPDDAGVGLAGSGLMIVNPPYGTDEYLRDAYTAIHSGIAVPGAGYVEVARLTPERMAQ